MLDVRCGLHAPATHSHHTPAPRHLLQSVPSASPVASAHSGRHLHPLLDHGPVVHMATTPMAGSPGPRPAEKLSGHLLRRRCWHPHALPPDHTDTQMAADGAAVSEQALNTAVAHSQQTTVDGNPRHGRASRKGAPDCQEKNLANLGKHSYRIVLAYDGTRFQGWQLQGSAPTVQWEVERALGKVLQEERSKLGVKAAGRTDAGVHASGQCVQFWTDQTPPPGSMHRRLNKYLPPDVRALAVHRTAPDFHVTISAQAKVYRYLVDTGQVHDPCMYHYRAHHRNTLDLSRMQEAAGRMVGMHDFTQFCNYNSDTARRNPVKCMRRVEVSAVHGGVQIEVEGTGFLYRQVRHMVGCLLVVGSGYLSVDSVSRSLQIGASQPPGNKGIHRGWMVAPAKGLSLHAVLYPPGVDDPNQLLFPEYQHDEWGRLTFQIPDSDGGD